MKRQNIVIPADMVIVAALVVAVAIVVTGNDDEPGDAEAGDAAVVRDDSHRLSSAPADAPVFVEFLDVECEACGAAYPAIEELRAAYGDRIQFVARYFPLDGHFNAQRAARAVEPPPARTSSKRCTRRCSRPRLPG
jgi:protein-disulfide isomerase